MRIKLCDIAQLANRKVFGIDIELNTKPYAFLIINNQHEIRAYHNICPHAGRRLDWSPGEFLCEDHLLICAAHGACFTLSNGCCISGPCKGQSLIPVNITIDATAVWLDTLLFQ